MKYVIAILIILFASFADIFLFRVNIIPFQPSFFLIPLFFIIFILKYSVLEFIDVFNSHSFKFFASILFLSIIYAAISEAEFDIIISKISLNSITLLLYAFSVHFFRTENKKLIFGVMFTAFLVLSGSMWYDFFIGLPKHDIKLELTVRKGGFGENPNLAASGIKFLALSVLIFLQKNKFKRNIFIAIMVISVFLTFSRSGIISVVLILFFGTMNSWSSNFKITAERIIKSSAKIIFLFSLLYIMLLFLSGIIKDNFPAFTRGSAGDRIDLLLGKGDKGIISEDVGTGGRGDLLIKYLNNFYNKPFGYGTGYSTDKRFNGLNSHNYYLYLAVNLGALALIIYLIYLFYSLKIALFKDQFYYFIFLILLVFEGFISHSVFYERPIIICLAFFDSFIYKKNLNYIS